MNKNCAFSICAKNYIPLARLLGQSILNKSKECDFYIIIADEIDDSFEKLSNEFVAKDILGFDNNTWNSLAFKYDVTEFCTFLKPYSFEFFLKKYSNVCYIDPDIYFYDSFDKVIKEFSDCEFLLTPHISYVDYESADHIQIEDELRGSGLFNFGFLGLKKSKDTLSFVKWWQKRLYDKCYRDSINYLYTDQVWGNYILTYYDLAKIKVIKHLGWNIAPWNYSEREIELHKDKLFVKKRNSKGKAEPVLFVHYSGYNYAALCDGTIEQNNNGHEYLYSDINLLFDKYRTVMLKNKEALKSGLLKKYSYNFYSNGKKIQLFHRRLFRSLMINNIDVGNPFDCNNQNFYLKLNKAKLVYDDSGVCRNTAVVSASSTKLKVLNSIMRMLYRILGVNRYISFLKLLKGYGQFENQLHLIDSKYNVLWYRKIIVGLDNKE